jgi:VanZ family protein
MRVTLIRSLFWAGVVAVSVVSVTSRDDLPPVDFDVWDKLQHGLVYAVLSGLGGLAYPARKHLAVLFLSLVAWGGVLEVIQLSAPNREAEFGDAVANAVGVGMGLLAVGLAGNAFLRARRD